MTGPSARAHTAGTVANAVRQAAVPIIGVTATQLGEHLDLTRQRVGVLADVDHVLERLPDGRFDLDAARTRYIRFLRSERARSPKATADAEHIAARRRCCASRSPRSSASWCPGRILMLSSMALRVSF